MKKNIKIVFDNVIENNVIPNGMPKYMADKYVSFLKENKNLNDIHTILPPPSIHPTPYDDDIIFSNSSDITTLNELDDTIHGDYLTSASINYLYYIGSGGWLREGLKPEENSSNTSYFDNLSDTVKEFIINKKNFYLFFKNGRESIELITLERIYFQANTHKIPLDKIILVTDSASYDILKNQIEEKYKINFNLKYFAHYWALFQAGDVINELLCGYTDYTTSDPRGVMQFNIVMDFKKNRKNKFLCFNRRLKPGRVAMISFLLGMGYENIYLSHDNSDTANNELVERLIADSDISEKIEIGFNKLMNGPSRRIIDIEDFENAKFIDIPDNSKLYETSYFSIVTESSIDFTRLRFTEKLMKPIINLHPFVVFGSCGVLKLLRYFGFKTFSDFWDESYDEISDDMDRFVALTKVIDNLTNLTNDEWDELTEKIKPILIHNRDLIKQFTLSNKEDVYFENLNKLLENKFSNHYYSII